MAQVPKEVWAAILGAVIAAAISGFTTWRANANARRMLGMQLEDAAKQSEAKRRMDLRRDVFLPALQEAAKASHVLGEMTGAETDSAKANEQMKAVTAALAGIHAVGSAETVTATFHLAQFVGEIFAELAIRRAESVAKFMLVTQLALLIDKELANGNALTEMMKACNLQGGNAVQFARVMQQWEGHQKLLATMIEDRDKATLRYRQSIARSIEYLAKNLSKLTELQSGAILAMRRELDLSIDEEVVKRIASEAAAHGANSLDKLTRFLQRNDLDSPSGQPSASVSAGQG
ncbi:hypothetical protein HDG32_003371 [Paraburkholderia sp. CI2]|uniref:hypothetical protein n=1 Tax=Paraburkholderia sp. CI2 TaxID=2723093 RepID=UPI00161931E2|nr:hypothetical protein [Paraburkholderia sp. CI2]MBB5467251.1 hypothetical protein [Paraburkholderia sp. CI2]